MSEFESPEADRLLAGLWAQDEPPARDPTFVIAAMERIERRRLLEGVLALIPVALGASLLLWAFAPVIAAAASVIRLDANVLGPVVGGLVMALFLWSWASDRLRPLEV